MSAEIIMVASGKGGTGKSTVSVLLGGRLAAAGQRVLLIELDSGLRSVDIISGVYGKTVYDIEDVLCGRCEGSKAVVESPLYPGLSVISAPYEGGHVSPEALKKLADSMREFFDILLIDTAAGVGEPFRAAQKVCDRALLVLTPDPVTLRDGKIVADLLYDSGVNDVRLVLNKVNSSTFNHGAVRDLDECIDTVAIQLIAVLPESSALQIAAAKGELVPMQEPVMMAVENLAARVKGKDIPLLIR